MTRLRTELARVRAVIARADTNGISFTVNGISVSQIQYDTALKRQTRLETEIGCLEARLAGVQYHGGGIATTKTVVHTDSVNDLRDMRLP